MRVSWESAWNEAKWCEGMAAYKGVYVVVLFVPFVPAIGGELTPAGTLSLRVLYVVD